MPKKKLLTDSECKRRQKQRDRSRGRRIVSLGTTYERWQTLFEESIATSHAEFAEILLDKYEEALPKPGVSWDTNLFESSDTLAQPMSTPQSKVAPTIKTPQSNVVRLVSTPAQGSSRKVLPPVLISDIEMEASSSSCAEGSSSGMSGVRYVSESEPDKSILHIDMDATIPYDWTDDEEEVDTSDEDYEPIGKRIPMSITLGPKNIKPQDIPQIGIEEEANGGMEEKPVFSTKIEVDIPNAPKEIPGNIYPPIRHIHEGDDIKQHRFGLISIQSLLDLANASITRCTQDKCDKPVLATHEKHIGSATYLVWECSDGHRVHRWCGQPFVRGIRAGDLLLSTAIATSGNNFYKISKMFKFMNTDCVGRDAYYQYQRRYIAPTVKGYWLGVQEKVIDAFEGKDVILIGDGRMDSPGFCAKYCTYTIMDIKGNLLDVEVVDKREVEMKSVTMEKEALKRGLNFLVEQQFNLKELATDAHVQIKAMMKRDYSGGEHNIKHSFDVWHGAKNIAKKLSKLAEKKDKKELLRWIPEVVRHFWYCAEHCEGSVEQFTNMWRGVVHHPVNTHTWFGIESNIKAVQQCKHDEIDPSEPPKTEYLKKGSPAHRALVSVVLNKDLLNNIPYYVNSRHTGECEVFNNLLLSYASKRFAFRYENYEMRSLLAAIDHQNHLDRKVMVNKKGEEVMCRVYSKRTNNWTVKPVKTQKEYKYIPDLTSAIFDTRIALTNPLRDKGEELPENHPRRISSNIASIDKRHPPSTKELTKAKKSRFL